MKALSADERGSLSGFVEEMMAKQIDVSRLQCDLKQAKSHVSTVLQPLQSGICFPWIAACGSMAPP